MAFDAIVALASLIAAAIASITGFGIGSLLTPVFALGVGTRLAVAIVAIPHFAGTVLRFVIMRRHVDRRVVLGFGVASAVGGLTGALLHVWVSSRALSVVFGALLVLAALSEWTRWMSRVHWGRRMAWIAGTLSGLLGGLVGNQGGIRSAAMLGFEVPKESFVATATAIGVCVDLARLPVYLVTQGHEIAGAWRPLVVASVAVLAGTLLGARLLHGIPERAFRNVVAVVLLALGGYMIARG